MTLTSASSDKHRQRARKRVEGERIQRGRGFTRGSEKALCQQSKERRCEEATEGINRMIPMGGWIEGRKDTDKTA